MQALILISAGVGLVSGAMAAVAAYLLVGVLSWRLTLCTSLGLAGLDAVLCGRLLTSQTGWLMPALLYFAAAGTVLAIVDVLVHRLPDSVVLPSYPVLGALLALAAIGSGNESALARAGLGALALFVTYFLLALLYPPGMGFGDVKLAGLVGGVGAFVSWSTVLTATLVSFGSGAVVGLAVIASRRGTRRTAVPFGPFMLAGAVLAVLLAPASGT